MNLVLLLKLLLRMTSVMILGICGLCIVLRETIVQWLLLLMLNRTGAARKRSP